MLNLSVYLSRICLSCMVLKCIVFFCMYAKILWCIVDTASCRGVMAFRKHNHTHTQYMHAPDGPSDLTAAAILEVWIRCEQLACGCVCYHADDRIKRLCLFSCVCVAQRARGITRVGRAGQRKGGGRGCVDNLARKIRRASREKREERRERVAKRQSDEKSAKETPERSRTRQDT